MTCGCGNPYHFRHPSGAQASSAGAERFVEIEADVLGRNQETAERNRARLATDGVLALNLVSSPGSGKTSLLVETLMRLAPDHPVAVIEGDQQTRFDAERIEATGVTALQINTGKACHLDARQIEKALAQIAMPPAGYLFIENVGNLICPAGFDLGEKRKVVVLSVTEGEDKPLKYPDMFAASDLMLLNKVDLLPHLCFDVARCCDYARRVKPAIRIILTSAVSGEGLDEWLAWLEAERSALPKGLRPSGAPP